VRSGRCGVFAVKRGRRCYDAQVESPPAVGTGDAAQGCEGALEARAQGTVRLAGVRGLVALIG
jgi:hypothetical protein